MTIISEVELNDGTTRASLISRQQSSTNAYWMYREELATYGSPCRGQRRYRLFSTAQMCHLVLVKDNSRFAGRGRNRSRCLGSFGGIAIPHEEQYIAPTQSR